MRPRAGTTKDALTEVAPDDLWRRRPADFAVEASVAPLDHFQDVQLAVEQRRLDQFPVRQPVHVDVLRPEDVTLEQNRLSGLGREVPDRAEDGQARLHRSRWVEGRDILSARLLVYTPESDRAADLTIISKAPSSASRTV
ncbi:hypothetical protein EYF80_010317 [Liparis tanakae]|uniref:Uncharacterized protein n=1 Tax=Liparis tanakae TaxID=230148 RepID=A0A4Z2IN65_9TELE|nr:hypothetical protein EYF80_010317 [Liparis tanakae]